MAKVPTNPITGAIHQFVAFFQSLTGLQRIEGLIIACITPFLLFPTQFPLLTAAALMLLPLIWLTTSWHARPSPHTFTLLLFTLTLAIAILVTADPDLTLPKATGVLLGLTIWRFLTRTIQTSPQFYPLTALFLLLSLGFILLGALNAKWFSKIPYLTQILNLLPSTLIPIPEANPAGVHANQLAGTILLAWPLLLAFWEKKSWLSSTHKYWLVPATALLTFILVLTQSRTGWLAALSALGFLLLSWSLIWQKSRQRQLIRLAFASSLLIAIFVLLWIGPQKLQNIWNNPNQQSAVGALGSISYRQEVWQWAIAASSDFSFTGTGLGSFRKVVQRLYPINMSYDSDIGHAHNIFLQVALDLGLPGLIAYLALVGLSLWQGWQVAQHNADLRPFSIGLITSQVAFHIFGLTDAIALGAKPSLLFWYNLALIAAMYNLTFPPPPLAEK